MPLSISAADELLTTTRAVRKRLDFARPVPREIVIECVRIAQQAPTPSNTQRWRWLLIDDAEKRRALGEIYRRAGAEFLQTAHAAAQQQGDPQTIRVYESAVYLGEHMGDAPILAIPCLDARPQPEGSQAGFYGGIFPAVWSFNLALRARGLGTVLTTLHLREEKAAADLLGIPDTVTQCALLPIAYTIGADFKPAKRPPPESIIHWNAW
jgi:nitroreductase